MNKGKYFSGQPIFSQLINLIPGSIVSKACEEYKGDYYCKRFKTYGHLVTMLYSIFNRCDSLREVSTGLLACQQRLSHIRLGDYAPRRSTIADANIRRSEKIFQGIYLGLLKRYEFFLSDSRPKKKASKLYIFDSTVITLFHEILGGMGLPNAKGKRKGGIKVHTLIRSDQDVPNMILFSSARANDNGFLKKIYLPKGSILVFDRGFNDYATYNRFKTEGITWVTRLRQRTIARVVTDRILSCKQKTANVLSDQIVVLGHEHKKNATKVTARLIKYYDDTSGKTFQFLTNNLKMAPLTIAMLYKKRWQIELLFKRMKQNYPLKYFLGDSENAIKIQIWSALIADLLLKLVKTGYARKWSFSNLASMVRLHLMTYIKLTEFLKSPENALVKLIKLREKDYALQLFPQ